MVLGGVEGETVHVHAQPCSCALLRNSQAHHYHTLWALDSGSQSLRTPRSPLSPCHVNAPSWLRLVQLVAPTHTVISRRGGRTVRARGQREWWLGRSGVWLVLGLGHVFIQVFVNSSSEKFYSTWTSVRSGVSNLFFFSTLLWWATFTHALGILEWLEYTLDS